jgi:prephenate dehydrogenase
LRSGSKVKKLRIANIRILFNEELYQWKLDNWNKKTKSISCVFPRNVNVEVIEKAVMKIENIISIDLVDTYDGPQIDDGYISLTFKVTGLEKSDIDNVKELFTGFGGVIR